MFESVIDFDALMPLIIDIAILVFLSVQGLKVYQVIKDGQEGKFGLGAALVFGILFAAKMVYEPIAPYVDLAVVLFAGSLSAGLFYRYFVKPIFEKLGVPVSNADLNG